MEVKCQYSEKCVDKDKRCASCKNNEKRSYYEPIVYPYYPSYPYYPYPYYPWITWETTAANNVPFSHTVSYYESK